MCDLINRWKSILFEIEKFPGITLLVVSKNVSSDSINQLFNNGQIHFGENRVQELSDKANSLSYDIKWHFIGHLQSNKCSLLLKIPNLYMIESLDSLDIVLKLIDILKKDNNRTLLALVQINTSLKETQFGIDYRNFDTILHLINIIIESNCLIFRGLMTIGDCSKDCFNRLVDLKLKLVENNLYCKLLSVQNNFILSMGMSNDYKLAISCGSTQVRIGSLLFK